MIHRAVFIRGFSELQERLGVRGEVVLHQTQNFIPVSIQTPPHAVRLLTPASTYQERLTLAWQLDIYKCPCYQKYSTFSSIAKYVPL